MALSRLHHHRQHPSQGWTQLYDLLNADPAVRHRPRWSADIRYSSVPGLAAAPPTGIVDDVQGVVVVVTLEDARHPPLGQQLVKTRSGSGALRVAAANGSLLTLQAEGGPNFTFDIAARRFR
jgi:hypothetical protein